MTPVPQEHQKPAEQVSKVKHVKKAKQKHAKAAKQVTKAIQGRDHKRGNPDKAGKPATKGVKTHKPGQKPPKATTPAPVSGQAAPAKNGKGGHRKGRHKPKP